MPNHTPGPWKVAHYKDGEPTGMIIGSDYSLVATYGGLSTTISERHLANARLIAAAPELLESLENARIALRFYREWMARESKPFTDYPFGKDAEKAARAAIAKATGEGVGE